MNKPLFTEGQKVTVNGYPGIIRKVEASNITDLYEVRLDSGMIAVFEYEIVPREEN